VQTLNVFHLLATFRLSHCLFRSGSWFCHKHTAFWESFNRFKWGWWRRIRRINSVL